jgi:tetratricopeptide (TPR) repeat protein
LQLAEIQANTGDLDGAKMTLDALLAKVPDSIEAQSALARIQLSNRDWKALATTAALLLEQRPDHPLGHYLQALSLQQQGDLPGALAELEQALAIAPKAPEPRQALARVQMALDQAEAAEATAAALLRDLPTNITAAELLGQIQVARGKVQEAAATYREMMKWHPRSPTGYLGLASVQERGGELEAAIATLEQGADATERNAFLLFNLGNLIQKSGGDAIDVYQEVLEKAPNADVVANNLAMLLLMQPDLDQAMAARALELAKRFEGSEQSVFLDTLGWAYFKTGDYQRALTTLTRAVELDAFAELEYHLGMTYQALGRVNEARAALQRALADGGTFPGIEEARATLEQL